MLRFIWIIVSFALVIVASITTAATTPIAPHLKCLPKEVSRKDCHLTAKPYQIQISRLKVTWTDGTWTSIADAPLSDEKYLWEKVELSQMDKRWILQFWIWDDGKGEAKVQSLHWVVVELKDQKLVSHLDQVVRKREVRDTKPVSYGFDAMTPHSLKKIKHGLQWTVGKNVGTI